MRADWSLTNHQRLGSCLQRTELTGRAQAPAPALRPRVPVLVPAHCTAWHWDWRQNKLDFSSFGETEQSSSHVSHQCYAHVTKTDSAGHRDIWSHLSSWEWRMKGGYCQQSFYKSRHRQSINLLNQSTERSSVKKLSTLGTESIHLDTHATRDLSDLTSHNVTCQLIPLSLYFMMRSMMMMVNWILTRDITLRSGNTMLFLHKKVQQNVATTAGAGGRQEKLLNLTTQHVNSLAQMLCKRFKIYYIVMIKII